MIEYAQEYSRLISINYDDLNDLLPYANSAEVLYDPKVMLSYFNRTPSGHYGICDGISIEALLMYKRNEFDQLTTNFRTAINRFQSQGTHHTNQIKTINPDSTFLSRLEIYLHQINLKSQRTTNDVNLINSEFNYLIVIEYNIVVTHILCLIQYKDYYILIDPDMGKFTFNSIFEFQEYFQKYSEIINCFSTLFLEIEKN